MMRTTNCILHRRPDGHPGDRPRKGRLARALWAVFFAMMMLSACTESYRDTATLLRIERLVSVQPDSALSAIDGLPSTLSYPRFCKGIHTSHCAVRLYFFKAAHVLAHATPDSALYWVREARKAAMAGYRAPADSWFAVAEDTLQLYQDLCRADSIAQWMHQLSVYAELEAMPMAEQPMMAHKSDSLSTQTLACLHRACAGIEPHATGRNAQWAQVSIASPYLYALIACLSLLLMFLLYHQRREKQKQDDNQQIMEQQGTITALQNSIQISEKEKHQLHEQLTQNQQMRSEHIGKGKIIFDQVMAGGTMKNISIADEQCFVDYYAFAHAGAYQQLTAAYHALSLRHTTYLILCQMGFSNPQIAHILFVQPSTLRNYRLRIKRNLKIK